VPAKYVQLDMHSLKTARHFVFLAFQERTRTKQERHRVNNAQKMKKAKTPVRRNAILVRKVDLPWQEVHRAPIVWPANLKKRQTTKRFVPPVHRAITRTRQTWTRASNAHLGMPNRLQDKRRALNAAPVNSKMLPVRFIVHCVQIRPTLVKKEETVVVLIAQLVGHLKMAVRNVSRVVRVRLAMGVKNVHWGLPEKETTIMLPNANNVN